MLKIVLLTFYPDTLDITGDMPAGRAAAYNAPEHHHSVLERAAPTACPGARL